MSLTILLCSGCITKRTEYCLNTTPVERPNLLVITAGEVKGLSQETLNKLGTNERRLMNWGKVNYRLLNMNQCNKKPQ